MTGTVPSTDGPVVETKVKAATAGATVLVVILAVLAAWSDNEQLLSGFPDWVPVLVAALLTGGATFQAGYSAKHSPRPELPSAER